MTPSLIAACLWAIAANVIAMFPSKSAHWPAAWGLIAVGWSVGSLSRPAR